MKISHNWLNQFINTDKYSKDTISEILTDTGLEIEGLEKYESVKGSLNGVVVGKVLTCERIPETEKLKVTTVEVGAEEPLQIVCGAPNVTAGINVPVATIGTVLYTPKGDEFEIKKGKIRGVVSFGMICAEDELAIGTSHDGIMILDDSIAPGTPMNQVVNIEEDSVYEIGLTPNRSDAMGHWGVARDLRAALVHLHKDALELTLPSVENFKVDNTDLTFEVKVEDAETTPRYAGLSISGVKIQESPEWLKNRLKALGLTPKNNIVDITNYVMHDLGQPLHAFDAAEISGNVIEVKSLDKGTKFTTLDEVERSLNGEEIMICDAEKPMCIAGVLGGINSGVSEKTNSIFLESAYFNPVKIRKAAKAHTINSDASFRFERGIDPKATIFALKRAALLIQELAGGLISSEITDLYPKEIENVKLTLNYKKVDTILGQVLDRTDIKQILGLLDIQILSDEETALNIEIPAYRADVTREIDVIEEILRIYGYNNIELPSKLNTSIVYKDKKTDHKARNLSTALFTANGLNEIMMNSLTKVDYLKINEEFSADKAVNILNPLSADLSVMRQSLLHGGLETIAYNVNRRNNNIGIFEFGKSYLKEEQGKYKETNLLSIWYSGDKTKESWNTKVEKTNFFQLKSTVNILLEKFGLDFSKLKEVAESKTYFSDALAYELNGKTMVSFGKINKKTLKAFSISQEVFFAEINWDYLLKTWRKQSVTFKAIPKFPAVKRDLALLVDQKISYVELKQIAERVDKKLIKSINLFDVYEGDKLAEGKKSYAMSFILEDQTKTLNDKQIDKVMTKIQKTLAHQLGAELRQ